MTSILSVKASVSGNQLKCNYLKIETFFLNFFPHLQNLDKIWNTLKKKMSQRGYLLLKLQTAKSGVTQMPKKRSARTLVDSQRVKGSETLLKSEQQYFSHIFSSL